MSIYLWDYQYIGHYMIQIIMALLIKVKLLSALMLIKRYEENDVFIHNRDLFSYKELDTDICMKMDKTGNHRANQKSQTNKEKY